MHTLTLTLILAATCTHVPLCAFPDHPRGSLGVRTLAPASAPLLTTGRSGQATFNPHPAAAGPGWWGRGRGTTVWVWGAHTSFRGDHPSEPPPRTTYLQSWTITSLPGAVGGQEGQPGGEAPGGASCRGTHGGGYSGHRYHIERWSRGRCSSGFDGAACGGAGRGGRRLRRREQQMGATLGSEAMQPRAHPGPRRVPAVMAVG